MADLKISQLNDGNPAQSNDQIPINRSGSNFRITAGSIASLATGNAADTEVLFNDGGVVEGNPALTFNKTGGIVSLTGQLNVDNVRVDGNTISSTDTNGNIALTPNGTGEVDITKVDIDGGAVDGTTIGATTPSTGSFTTLTAQELNVISVASFAWKSNQTAPGGVFVPMPITLTKSHLGMRRCLVLDNGTVNYYLDPQDSTKKADGTASVLTGADGMVMVEIPKFYTRRVVTDTITQWFVADSALPGYAVHPAFIKDGVEVNNRYYGAYDACLFTTKAITEITQANPAVVTCTGHGLVTGDVIKITGVVGMTEVNDQTFTVTAVDANTFSIGVDSTGYGAYTSGGDWKAYLSGLNLDNATARYVAGSSKLTSISGIYPMVGLTRAEFRTAASNRGTFWRQVDFTLWSAVQMLYLSEFQSFFSQNILGAGNTNGTYLTSSTAQSDSPHTIAGASNFMGNMSTNSVTGAGISLKPGTSFMCYRGIENFFGNCWNWADGINVNVTTNGNVHVTNNRADFADNTSTNMTLIATTLPTGSGFISALQAIDNYFLASSVSGGSATTYMTDQHFGSTSSNRVVSVGGIANNGATAGAFCVFASFASSDGLRYSGARLAG